MDNGNQGFGGTRWRSVLVAAVVTIGTLWTSVAMATITQGDLSVFGFFETRESGQWGEGSARDSTPTTDYHPWPGGTFAVPGKPFGFAGGSFDFNHWDLAEQRNLADVRPDYHMVKNYKFLGRFDTLLIKDADFFAFYRPWYDSYGSLKNNGRQAPNTDVVPYNSGNRLVQTMQDEFFKDDLREYYAQLNFTDNLSARIGKQEVIWSEADALSGTEVTNPVNARWHGVYGAESPEDTRTNLRMIKFNYILPDYFKTANNEIEAFIIPGDFEGAGLKAQTDPRNPWVAPVVLGNPPQVSYNQNGQPFNSTTLPESGARGMAFVGFGPPYHGKATGQFYDVMLTSLSHTPSNKLQNSEFGVRLSSLLPIGNGLQASLIYLYEFRDARPEACTNCKASATGEPGAFGIAPGEFIDPGWYPYGKPRPGVVKGGTFQAISETDYRRNSFFGLTGTYYDKDLTDVVYRYDLLYQPDHAVATPSNWTQSAWTQLTRWIVAGDRPTYIPWLSKQHTFLVAQYTMTWYPDRPANCASIVVPGFAGPGKLREVSNFALLSATNWLMNGQLTTGNTILDDIDDNVFEVSSSNTYRYSRNILLGLNAAWFLGRSGRITDPYLLSREQRFNELEFTFTYEI